MRPAACRCTQLFCCVMLPCVVDIKGMAQTSQFMSIVVKPASTVSFMAGPESFNAVQIRL